jgi:hypothetical protein
MLNRIKVNLQVLIIVSTVFIFSCSDNGPSRPIPENTLVNTWYENKPPSAYPDTLKITSVAAVFYSPDSLQLLKIKSISDAVAFGSKMHEYEYLSKTAHSVIDTHFPQINIIEAKKVRYLLFTTAEEKDTCIDLDRNYEPYGLYVFDRQKAPQPVDMANTETDLGFYFTK